MSSIDVIIYSNRFMLSILLGPCIADNTKYFLYHWELFKNVQQCTGLLRYIIYNQSNDWKNIYILQLIVTNASLNKTIA